MNLLEDILFLCFLLPLSSIAKWCMYFDEAFLVKIVFFNFEIGFDLSLSVLAYV